MLLLLFPFAISIVYYCFENILNDFIQSFFINVINQLIVCDLGEVENEMPVDCPDLFLFLCWMNAD